MSKGISLYIAIVVMAILLAIVFGVSTILLSQIKMIKGIENSVIAFYAADSGIERALMEEDPLLLNGYSETLDNGEASYVLTVLPSGDPNCNASSYCIKAVGSYRETRRAIEVSY